MIKKVVFILLVVSMTNLIVYAEETNTERNKITRSEAFWKLYTDALRGEKAAQFETGVMYERGMGVEQNQTQAAKWYEKAAIQGHKDAQFNLGIMYGSGRGVEQNDQFAMMWLASAARQGDKEARTLLLDIIDGKQKTNSNSNNDMEPIKAIRFETKEGASLCSSLNDDSQCSVLKKKQIYTSKSKQGNYYKISGIATGHGWKAYEGDGWIESSMVDLK